MAYSTKIITFSDNSFKSSKPTFSQGSTIKGLVYSNNNENIKFTTNDYGYVTLEITYSGTSKYAGFSFSTDNGSTFSIGVNGIDNLFLPFKNGKFDQYDIVLSPNVTKTIHIILNPDSKKITNNINILGSVGKKAGTSSSSEQITINYECVITPLYKYLMGLHVYSAYDSIFTPKLNTYLYSKNPINNWVNGSRVWSSSTFDVPALQYYYGYGNNVYKIGGPVDRSFGTKEKYEVWQTLWRKIRSKPPEINKIVIGPSSFYNSSDDTIDACINVLLTDAGIIKEIVNKNILPTPTKYKYYMGYDVSNKQLSNDNFFAKFVFSESKFYPITGLQHLMYRLVNGYVVSTGFNVNLSNQIGPLLLTGIPLLAAGIILSVPALSGAISSIFIYGGPFSSFVIPLFSNPVTATAVTVIAIALLVIGFFRALTKKTKTEVQELCKKFLCEYTTTPYIELNNPLSRTPIMSVINNGYFSDGVYFYTQSGSQITQKELSSTNALVSEQPISREFMYSLTADEPNTVVDVTKLLLLPYTSGIPIEFSVIPYFSPSTGITVNITDNGELTQTPNDISYIIPSGYVISYIGQIEANTQLQNIILDINDIINNTYNYSETFSDLNLGELESSFTHEIRIESSSTDVNCYYDNTNQSGATINKKLFYDTTGKIKVLNGYYAVSGETYYRTFYKVINGTIVDIYNMLYSNSTTVTGTTDTISVINVNLNYSSNWYITSFSLNDIIEINNNILSQKYYNTDTLYSQTYVRRGYYNQSGDSFYLYDNNTNNYTLNDAPASDYKPLIDWLTEPPFSYYPPLSININIEEICLPSSSYNNSLYGFYIKGGLNGYEVPLYNEVGLTIKVYINNDGLGNVLKHTYNVTTNSSESTYISYSGFVSISDNVTLIEIFSINTTNPTNKITYTIGNFIGCVNPTPTSTSTPTPTPTSTSTPTPTSTSTPTPTPSSTSTPTPTSTSTPTPTPTSTETQYFTYIFAEPQTYVDGNNLDNYMITENNKIWGNYQSYGVPDIVDYSDTLDVYVHWSGWTSNSGNYITQPTNLKGLIKTTVGSDTDTFGCNREQYTFGTIEIETTDVNPNIPYFYSIWIPFQAMGGSFVNMLINAGTSSCDTDYVEYGIPDSVSSRNVTVTSGGAIPAGDYRVLWLQNLRLPITETLTNNIYIKGHEKVLSQTPTPTPTQFCPSTITDYDGNVYNVVNINGKCWMSENLKNTTYQNSTSISLVESLSSWSGTTNSAYTYVNGNSGNTTNYGLLYNGYSVTGSTSGNTSNNLCPVGWHVPTKEEFDNLSTYLGGSSISGGKMKSTGTTYWNSPNTGADNSSGFSARGAGFRVGDPDYDDYTQYLEYARYHTTDEITHIYLAFNSDDYRNDGFWSPVFGLSIRCLKD